MHRGVERLRVDANGQRYERLEEGTQEHAICGCKAGADRVPQKPGSGRTQKPCGKGRVGQMVFGRLRETGQQMSLGDPAGYWIQKPKSSQRLAIADRCRFGRLVCIAWRGGIKDLAVSRRGRRCCARMVRPAPGRPILASGSV